jgi:hypothetical protein
MDRLVTILHCLLFYCLFIVLMMPTWLDETRRQNSTNFWCVGIFSIFRDKKVRKRITLRRKPFNLTAKDFLDNNFCLIKKNGENLHFIRSKSLELFLKL